MDEEKKVMSRGFIVFAIIQSITVVILCFISMNTIRSANISKIIPVDIITLLIAIIFLSLIVLIVGWSSAAVNMSFIWGIFHFFMIILLLIEMVICMLTSSVDLYVRVAENNWRISDEADRRYIEINQHCKGFANVTDFPGNATSEYIEPCKIKIQNLFTDLRNSASVALFVCFVFGMFIDFAACAICFHPEVVRFEDQEIEERMAYQSVLRRANVNKPSTFDLPIAKN